jgi:hypothetical protein
MIKPAEDHVYLTRKLRAGKSEDEEGGGGAGEGVYFMRKPSRTWYGARTLATCGRRQRQWQEAEARAKQSEKCAGTNGMDK